MRQENGAEKEAAADQKNDEYFLCMCATTACGIADSIDSNWKLNLLFSNLPFFFLSSCSAHIKFRIFIGQRGKSAKNSIQSKRRKMWAKKQCLHIHIHVYAFEMWYNWSEIQANFLCASVCAIIWVSFRELEFRKFIKARTNFSLLPVLFPWLE